MLENLKPHGMAMRSIGVFSISEYNQLEKIWTASCSVVSKKYA